MLITEVVDIAILFLQTSFLELLPTYNHFDPSLLHSPPLNPSTKVFCDEFLKNSSELNLLTLGTSHNAKLIDESAPSTKKPTPPTDMLLKQENVTASKLSPTNLMCLAKVFSC